MLRSGPFSVTSTRPCSTGVAADGAPAWLLPPAPWVGRGVPGAAVFGAAELSVFAGGETGPAAPVHPASPIGSAQADTPSRATATERAMTGRDAERGPGEWASFLGKVRTKLYQARQTARNLCLTAAVDACGRYPDGAVLRPRGGG